MNPHSNSIPPGKQPGNLERLTATQPSTLTPTAVLSLLEADQVVAAKQQTRFGSRQSFSAAARTPLGASRVCYGDVGDRPDFRRARHCMRRPEDS